MKLIVEVTGSPMAAPDWLASVMLSLLRGWYGDKPSIAIQVKDDGPNI
jgi:hypothetical protein